MKFHVVSNENRKLNINWDRVNTYVSRYKPGTPFDVEIVRRTPRVSNPMRRYYFAVVLPTFMDYLGYEKDEEELFHRQLKIVYFQIKPDSKGIYRNVPSVFGNESTIDIGKKKEYTDWVIRKASTEGVYIPDPGE